MGAKLQVAVIWEVTTSRTASEELSTVVSIEPVL